MRKLKEEKEKQTAMEERRRAAWGKRTLKGRRPAASDSGGESTRGPTPVEVGETNPEPTRRRAVTGGPGHSAGPLGLSRETGGPNQDGERSDGGGRVGWSTVAAGSKLGVAPGQPRIIGRLGRDGGTRDVPLPTLGRGGGGRGGPRPNTA